MKYFTKYLPVEQKPIPGSLVKSNGQICKCVKEVSEGEYEVDGFPRFVSNIVKVQLFLCSRDIQVGDTLKECLPDGIEQKIHHFESVLPCGVWVFEPWPSENEKWIHADKAFKVVGEVSPGATWVTEGMEFDEEDLEKRTGEFIINEPPFYFIKCPICKHFH